MVHGFGNLIFCFKNFCFDYKILIEKAHQPNSEKDVEDKDCQELKPEMKSILEINRHRAYFTASSRIKKC